MLDKDPQVLLMCGVSGSGKTYYSKKLQEKGYIRLSLDEYIWDRYGSGFTKMPFDKQQQIFQSASKELENKLLEHVSRGFKVVLDSTMCKRSKRNHVREICNVIGIEPLFIYMDTPSEELHIRISKRQGTGPNDQIIPSERLDSFISNFEVPDSDENFIVVKGY